MYPRGSIWSEGFSSSDEEQSKQCNKVRRHGTDLIEKSSVANEILVQAEGAFPRLVFFPPSSITTASHPSSVSVRRVAFCLRRLYFIE